MEQEYLMILQRVAGVCINRKAERERVDRLKDKMFRLANLKLKAHREALEQILKDKCLIIITMID